MAHFTIASYVDVVVVFVVVVVVFVAVDGFLKQFRLIHPDLPYPPPTPPPS